MSKSIWIVFGNQDKKPHPHFGIFTNAEDAWKPCKKTNDFYASKLPEGFQLFEPREYVPASELERLRKQIKELIDALPEDS